MTSTVVVKSAIVHIFFSDKSVPYARIDGTDRIKEGNFTSFGDGSVITYSNWAHGEPNNCCWADGDPNKCCGGEDCIVMHDNGQWNDVQCAHPHQAVCEI